MVLSFGCVSLYSMEAERPDVQTDNVAAPKVERTRFDKARDIAKKVRDFANDSITRAANSALKFLSKHGLDNKLKDQNPQVIKPKVAEPVFKARMELPQAKETEYQSEVKAPETVSEDLFEKPEESQESLAQKQANAKQKEAQEKAQKAERLAEKIFQAKTDAIEQIRLNMHLSSDEKVRSMMIIKDMEITNPNITTRIIIDQLKRYHGIRFV